jgi:putative FmdB family regulatory protein
VISADEPGKIGTEPSIVPIYEYACRGCGHQFETLVRTGDKPACPACAGDDLERLLSLPAIRSDTTHGLAMRAAKRRDAKRADERVRAQVEYEKAHDDHSP